MTNERDKNLTDELVSETYRKLDSPQVPDHLTHRSAQQGHVLDECSPFSHQFQSTPETVFFV